VELIALDASGTVTSSIKKAYLVLKREVRRRPTITAARSFSTWNYGLLQAAEKVACSNGIPLEHCVQLFAHEMTKALRSPERCRLNY
jgi:hypothetical protein